MLFFRSGDFHKILARNFKKMSSSSSFGGFTQRVYQKLTIKRLPHETFILFLDTNDTVSELFKHLQYQFPSSNFIATTHFQNKLGKAITEEDQKQNDEIKKLELIQLLIHTNILVYEVGKNVHNLCLGLELKEYRPTNNRNVLPQRIAQNIMILAEQWRSDRSIQFALSKNQQYNQNQHQKLIQQKQQLLKQARSSYQNYLTMHAFYKKQYLQTGKARSLMVNLITLMTANWVFLFAVTYGKYGWNVGEPLSYLSMLAVDLIAMLGIFSINDVVQKTEKQDWNLLINRMNLQSLLKTKEFLIAHTKRHY